MTRIIEAVYENGVLKPIDPNGLKEHGRYRLIVEELRETEAPMDAALAAELARRTTTLPDGRRIVQLAGILAHQAPPFSPNNDPIAEALEELRREREAQLQAKLEALFPQSSE
jgi:predicted DNA-binding antitoxin AbrB/MazE fold protein